MYKLVLNDGTAFDLLEPWNLTTVSYKGVETEAVQFTLADKDLGLKTLKACFQDDVATADFTIKFEDGALASRYTNYSNLAKIGLDENENWFIIMALTSDLPALLAATQKTVKKQQDIISNLQSSLETMEKNLDDSKDTMNKNLEDLTKDLEQKISDTQDTLVKDLESVEKNVADSNDALVKNLDDLSKNLEQSIETLSTDLTDVKNSLPTPFDLETATLEDVKTWQIELSKINLQAYLQTHPITSSVHGGIPKQYSITSEKQQYLAQMIMLAEGHAKMAAAVAGEGAGEEDAILPELPEFQVSWNAVGEPCTYDWTLEELYMLSVQIEQTVRPLVSRQQSMEAAINRAMSKSDVMSVDIEF